MVEEYLDRLGRLPCEILHNIALILPFSSIIQLRCSSKFWYNLLTDPKFVDLHLTEALQKPPGYLFTPVYQYWQKKKACYFVEESKGDLNTSKIFEYSFNFRELERWANFKSSGGLMCAYSSESYCFRIFNPHIAEEVQVPRDPKFERWSSLSSFIFGYSPHIKEYKILMIGELYCRSLVAKICTLGSNIWRDVKNVPSCVSNSPYTQCEGNPFWMADSNLHFFDLVSEKFQVIPGPPVVGLVHATHYNFPPLNFQMGTLPNYIMGTPLISMGHTVGYVDINRLWVLEDKTKGIWMNKYDFSIPPLYRGATLIGTSENGHLFGYIGFPSNAVFSHDMGCIGFKVWEMNLNEDGVEEEPRSIEYMTTPHVISFVSPVRIMKMGNKLNHKEKWVLDKLKLDYYDATKNDIFSKMYEVLQAYEKDDKSQDL